MALAEELRAQLAVAELEEQLAAAKAAGASTAGGLAEVKGELRYARWVARGGPAVEAQRLGEDAGHTNRAAADLYARWQRAQQGDRPERKG